MKPERIANFTVGAILSVCAIAGGIYGVAVIRQGSLSIPFLNNSPFSPPPPPAPKQQKILRIWRGNPAAYNAQNVCGIYTPPSEIDNLQSQGWTIKNSTPINYRINQRLYYYDCFGSEVVMER